MRRLPRPYPCTARWKRVQEDSKTSDIGNPWKRHRLSHSFNAQEAKHELVAMLAIKPAGFYGTSQLFLRLSTRLSCSLAKILYQVFSREQTDMTSINTIMWILIVVGLAIMNTAAAARALTALTPMASLDATTTVPSQDIILEWLKITAVPLGVFLIGDCTWGCIKNTVVWRSLTGRQGESEAPDADEVPADRPIDSSPNTSDLEVGLELSHRRMDDGLAMSAQTNLTMQQPSLQSQNDEGKRANTNVAPQALQRPCMPCLLYGGLHSKKVYLE